MTLNDRAPPSRSVLPRAATAMLRRALPIAHRAMIAYHARPAADICTSLSTTERLVWQCGVAMWRWQCEAGISLTFVLERGYSS